jgi:3-oxoacyl-(acyl-carrier-protein) reductase
MKKIIFITGSTRGIGKAIAYKYAKNGDTIILHGLNKSKESKNLIDDIKKISSLSEIFYFDVSKENQVNDACRNILSKFSKIDVLVNNAGILKDRTFLKMTTPEWDSVIKTNLYGPYFITKQIIDNMIKHKFGRIINISALIGQIGNFGQTNYAASKAGLIGFTKSLAKEVAKYNITVNAVSPGIVDTDILDKVPRKFMNNMLQKIPLHRMATASEIAEIVYFLGSSQTNYITGEVININGGWI